MAEKKTYVFLGRFSPIHKGHQMVIDKMLAKFGSKNCLIIVGSANSLNKRTPFTFLERKRMIKILYPNLKVLPIPDSTPNIETFSAEGDRIWLSNLKSLEKKLRTKFIFLGGSKKDLKVLSRGFTTRLFVQRHKEGMKLSATMIREKMLKGNFDEILKFVDAKILKLTLRVGPLRLKNVKKSESRVGP